MMFPFLFALIILISLYDLKYRKIPNWITLPLLLLGLSANLPGNPLLWVASAFVFSAWKFGLMGGGDAKLWMGLLWCLSSFGEHIVVWMFVALLVTGCAQLTVRTLLQKRVTVGFKTPGAWRTVVFMGLLAYLN
jgi:leader peptidase (prepilin peptidase)/N-methyltransferase